MVDSHTARHDHRDHSLRRLPTAPPHRPSILTRRLRKLVAEGLLKRRRYHDHPERYEYVLTRRGEQFSAVVLALAGWWNDTVEPQCRSIVVVDAETGAEVEPVVVDARTGPRLAGRRRLRRWSGGVAAGAGPSPAVVT